MEASPALSALELRVSADRGVCLFVCALTHSRGWEREIVSVLLPASLCETEGCPYRLSSRSIIDFHNKIRSNRSCN